jgi:Tol biopolymer transport system component
LDATPEIAATSLPPIAERLIYMAGEESVPEGEIDQNTSLWSVLATGGEAELIAENVRPHAFGNSPPWTVIRGEEASQLVFISGPDEEMKLIGHDLHSGEQVDLYTADEGWWISTPSASPDGKRLAFIAVEPRNNGEINEASLVRMFVLNVDGERLEREFEPATMWTFLNWSPDSQWLAAEESGGTMRWPRLMLFPSGGGDFVVAPFSRAWQATWMPESQRLVAVRTSPSGPLELVLWDVAEGEHETMPVLDSDDTQPPGVIFDLAWSSTGQYLAGQAGDDWGELGLYTIAADSNEPLPLHDPGDDEGFVIWYEWSPDGRQIAYLARIPGQGEGTEDSFRGYVVRPDGEDRWPTDSGLEGQAGIMAWSPDSQQLAFVFTHGEGANLTQDLYVTDLAQRQPSLIHEGLGRCFYLMWLPEQTG